MPGIKTSVWLGEAEHEQWKASGKSLTEIVKAGLAALGAAQGQPVTVETLREELDTALCGQMFEMRLTRIVRQEILRATGGTTAATYD